MAPVWSACLPNPHHRRHLPKPLGPPAPRPTQKRQCQLRQPPASWLSRWECLRRPAWWAAAAAAAAAAQQHPARRRTQMPQPAAQVAARAQQLSTAEAAAMAGLPGCRQSAPRLPCLMGQRHTAQAHPAVAAAPSPAAAGLLPLLPPRGCSWLSRRLRWGAAGSAVVLQACAARPPAAAWGNQACGNQAGRGPPAGGCWQAAGEHPSGGSGSGTGGSGCGCRGCAAAPPCCGWPVQRR